MNREQKIRFLQILIVVLLLFVFMVSYQWVINHWKILLWPGLALLFLIGLFSKNRPAPTSMATYTERHLEFNRVIEEYPWMKIYYVTYGIVVAIGVFYIRYNQIDMIDFLDKIGIFGLLGALSLVMVPVLLFKLKQLFENSGKGD